MKPNEELCMKFPAVLRDKLQKGEIEFPDGVRFSYPRIRVYRAVERKAEDHREVTLEDFKSYFELKKQPKSPRGVKKDFSKDPHYYGVSSFLKKEIVEQMMNFPNPRKKMAVGYVQEEGGPQDTNIKRQHVCWWLYENADVSGFRLKEE